MEFLIVALNFHPETIGAGKYNGDIARALVRRGHHVTVVTTAPYYPRWEISDGYSGRSYRVDIVEKVNVIRCPLWVPRNPNGIGRLVHMCSYGISSLPAALHQGWKHSDLVLSIAPTLLSAPSALLASRIARAKSWLHIQDFELDTALNLDMLPSARPLRWLMKAVEGWIMQRFDRVSSISRAMVERAALKGVPKDRLELLPNWVDTDRIFPEGCRRELFDIPHDKIVAMYSGNLGQKQGLLSLLAVARQLESEEDLHFVICGEGSMRRQIKRAAAEHKNVQFLPLQPEARLNDLLNAADMHLLPELAGASDLLLPSKLGGMLASGKPTIASAVAGSEIDRIVQGAGFVVPAGDVSGMARAIRRLASDWPLRQRLGRRARRYSEAHLSKEVILGSFAAALEALAN